MPILPGTVLASECDARAYVMRMSTFRPNISPGAPPPHPTPPPTPVSPLYQRTSRPSTRTYGAEKKMPKTGAPITTSTVFVKATTDAAGRPGSLLAIYSLREAKSKAEAFRRDLFSVWFPAMPHHAAESLQLQAGCRHYLGTVRGGGGGRGGAAEGGGGGQQRTNSTNQWKKNLRGCQKSRNTGSRWLFTLSPEMHDSSSLPVTEGSSDCGKRPWSKLIWVQSKSISDSGPVAVKRHLVGTTPRRLFRLSPEMYDSFPLAMTAGGLGNARAPRWFRSLRDRWAICRIAAKRHADARKNTRLSLVPVNSLV